jgi:hypothetical protein
LSDYRPIDGGGPFKAGVVSADGKIVGVVRIGLFSPQGYPTLCEQAVANARIAFQKPCDAVCDDLLLTEAYAIMTRGSTDRTVLAVQSAIFGSKRRISFIISTAKDCAFPCPAIPSRLSGQPAVARPGLKLGYVESFAGYAFNGQFAIYLRVWVKVDCHWHVRWQVRSN